MACIDDGSNVSLACLIISFFSNEFFQDDIFFAYELEIKCKTRIFQFYL